eukprot:5853906-Prorocentrum_lima.AAC.1
MQNTKRSYSVKSLEISENARKGCVVAFHNAFGVFAQHTRARMQTLLSPCGTFGPGRVLQEFEN